MKKTRYSEEQIIGVLKQMEAGRKVADLARELGVSEATLYTWKSKFGGLAGAGHLHPRLLQFESSTGSDLPQQFPPFLHVLRDERRMTLDRRVP